MPRLGRTIQRALLTTSGTADLIAAPGAGTRIYIVQLIVTASVAGTLKFQSGGSTDLTSPHDFAINGGLVLGTGNPNEVVMEANVNEKINVVGVTGTFHITARYFVAA